MIMEYSPVQKRRPRHRREGAEARSRTVKTPACHPALAACLGVLTWISLAGGALLAGPVVLAADERARSVVFFKIGTGSVAGTYFSVGDTIAGIISHPLGSVRCAESGACGPEGLIAVAEATEGSVMNVRAVADRSMDSALAQADVVHWAYQGEGGFDASQPALRAIANLYPEAVHLVARSDAGIESLADLAGKHVSIDRPGSGSHADARLILAALELSDEALTLDTLDPDMASARLEDGTLDAFFYTAGAPVAMVSALIADGRARLIPITGPAIDALRLDHTFLLHAEIPTEAYGQAEVVETLGVGALWITHADANPDLIYAMTAALWHDGNRPLLASGHPLAAQMDLHRATTGVPIPFHPGAERFYREQNALIGDGINPAHAGVEPEDNTL